MVHLTFLILCIKSIFFRNNSKTKMVMMITKKIGAIIIWTHKKAKEAQKEV